MKTPKKRLKKLILHSILTSLSMLIGIWLCQNGIHIPTGLQLLSLTMICANLHFSQPKRKSNLLLLGTAYCLLVATYSNQLALEYQNQVQAMQKQATYLKLDIYEVIGTL